LLDWVAARGNLRRGLSSLPRDRSPPPGPKRSTGLTAATQRSGTAPVADIPTESRTGSHRMFGG